MKSNVPDSVTRHHLLFLGRVLGIPAVPSSIFRAAPPVRTACNQKIQFVLKRNLGSGAVGFIFRDY